VDEIPSEPARIVDVIPSSPARPASGVRLQVRKLSGQSNSVQYVCTLLLTGKKSYVALEYGRYRTYFSLLFAKVPYFMFNQSQNDTYFYCLGSRIN